jgi:hypothetical protein
MAVTREEVETCFVTTLHYVRSGERAESEEVKVGRTARDMHAGSIDSAAQRAGEIP